MKIVVSIYVNPTQFAPDEDLTEYPRNLDQDLAALERFGPLTVFAPSDTEMYPPGCSTIVQPPQVAKPLEGEYRASHFGGVVTVVTKLLVATRADLAFFGQKDFQQLAVIRTLVRDLRIPVEIVGCPIVREPDGLAMSSRNVYLDEKQRQTALILNQTLQFVEAEIREGERDGHMLMAEMRQRLIDGGVDDLDYAVIADPETLASQAEVRLPAVALLAAQVGKTRLIDNCLIS